MHQKNQDNSIMVSIICDVYNQSEYLRKCLDGFVMQKTNFQYEILIHDDASTDDSPIIIEEYCQKYPDLFKHILQKENQYSKGVKIWKNFQFPRVGGKYMAFCEGDDYWCDPLKLQTQVDFMEQHPEHSMCFHAHANLYSDNHIIEEHRYNADMEICSPHQAIRAGGGFMATNSMLVRTSDYQDVPSWVYESPVGDSPMMLVLLCRGHCGYINITMSVYRCMSNGSWSVTLRKKRKNLIEHNKKISRMYRAFNRWSKYKFCIDIIYRQSVNNLALLKNVSKTFL